MCFEWMFQKPGTQWWEGWRGGWIFLAASSVRLVRCFLPALGPTNQPQDDQLTGGARQTGQLAFSTCVSGGSNSGCGVGELDKAVKMKGGWLVAVQWCEGAKEGLAPQRAGSSSVGR